MIILGQTPTSTESPARVCGTLWNQSVCGQQVQVLYRCHEGMPDLVLRLSKNVQTSPKHIVCGSRTWLIKQRATDGGRTTKDMASPYRSTWRLWVRISEFRFGLTGTPQVLNPSKLLWEPKAYGISSAHYTGTRARGRKCMNITKNTLIVK